MRDTFRSLWQVFGKYNKHLLALSGLSIISPLLEGIGINSVVPLISFFSGGVGAETDFITETIRRFFSLINIPFSFRYLLIFIFFLFLVRAISVVLFGYIRGWVQADFLSKESEDVLRRTLLSSWPFVLKQKIGTVQNSLVRDVYQTGNLLGSGVQILQSFSGFIIYLIIAINISPVMTFYTIAGGSILLFILRPLLRHTWDIGQQTAGVEKQFAQYLSEHVQGMKSIKAAGVERSAIANGSNHIHLLRKLSIKQSFITAVSSSFFQPFAMVLIVLLFLLTYNAPGFSIISFVASLYLIQKIFVYLESGQNSLQSINGLLPYVKSVAVFKQNLDFQRELAEGVKPFSFKNDLVFKDISFSYENSRRILEKINFLIKRGETIGLIGPSGTGKTSVADLMLRLFKPNSGLITLDGVHSDEISLEGWRKNIGYVPQDVFLFNGTIEENIRFYNKELSISDIETAAKQANIYDFIVGLPSGFKTTTGDRGVMLSGGQRQRIALARALASKPSILILDEATSALDSASEKMIQESIQTLRGSVTVFIIAHRLSTVDHADRLLVLDHGKILEQGTPQELLANPASYFYKHSRDRHG